MITYRCVTLLGLVGNLFPIRAIAQQHLAGEVRPWRNVDRRAQPKSS